MMSPLRIEAGIVFVVPVFIGGADQSAELRVPPFKSLLRYFWRIVTGRRFGYDYRPMRDAEGALFGRAGDRTTTRRSRVEVSLDGWKAGTLSTWTANPGSVQHPEVQQREAERHSGGQQRGGGRIASDLYLGYGALKNAPAAGRGRGPRSCLRHAPAIAAGTKATLRLRAVDLNASEFDDVETALKLMHWFGTVGSRSRNGWGSFMVERNGSPLPPLAANGKPEGDLRGIARHYEEAIREGITFAHAIGKDHKGLLVWRTAPMNRWEEVVRRLAELKIGFRTQFQFRDRRHNRPEDRHILAYPVTNHRVHAPGWGKNGRLANQLRYKIVRDDDGYRGVIVHLPARLPEGMRRGFNDRELLAQELRVWREVHGYLDGQRGVERLRA